MYFSFIYRFFARGTFQDDGKNISGISQPAISKIIRDFCDAMIPHVRHFIRFPQSNQELEQTKAGFYSIKGFPNTIGAIDGTHIWIKSPPLVLEQAYVCRKGGHTINVQIVCNADMLITYIVAKWPGSIHDSFVWSQCGLREKLLKDGKNGWLIGEC